MRVTQVQTTSKEVSRVQPKYKWPWLLIIPYILLVTGVYIGWFHDYDFSKAPSDWGTVGDYFGGLINPLCSILTLYFLINTYRAQKEELSETKEALKASAEHQRDAAAAQRKLAELEEKRLASAEQLLIFQILNAEITSKYDEIKFLSSEANRCTTAMNSNWSMPDLNGKKLHSDSEISNYRISCLDKITSALNKIESLRSELKKHHPTS